MLPPYVAAWGRVTAGRATPTPLAWPYVRVHGVSMDTNPDPNRRDLIQAMGCLSYIIGAAVVAGMAMLIWRII